MVGMEDGPRLGDNDGILDGREVGSTVDGAFDTAAAVGIADGILDGR